MEDKENAAHGPVSARAPGAGSDGAAPSWMKGTASSKQRVTADAGPSQQQGLAGTLRPNLNASNGALSYAERRARGEFHGQDGDASMAASDPSRRVSGVADLNSFRARLNVVKRESMMRQSLAMPFEQDTTGADRLGAPAPGATAASRPASARMSIAPIAENRPAQTSMPVARPVTAPSVNMNMNMGMGMNNMGMNMNMNSSGMVSSTRGSVMPALAEDPGFGGDMGFGADPFASSLDLSSFAAGKVDRINRQNFDDPSFVDEVERCLHFRPKALKGFDMKAMKDEAKTVINTLRQCLQQSLVRKEALVEELMRDERDREQTAEGVKLQMESANASTQAAEQELAALRGQLNSFKASAQAVEAELRQGKEAAVAELRRMKESTDWDARRAADDMEAKEVELSNLRRRHEESQESLRNTRVDLAAARESCARAERDSSALRRDRENGEAAYSAERRALEGQIRAKIDEVASERVKASQLRSEYDDKLRGAQGDAERLKVTNASLQARIESVENGSKTTKAELAGELATTRAELEGLARELDAERAARETETKELSDALAAAQAKSDDVEAQLATALADAASLKQKLKAQTQGAEDAQMEAEDVLSAKSSEIALLQKELEKASENIKKKEEEHAALTSELKLATDASEKANAKLSEDAAEWESERNKLSEELDKFKSEASENKGRADSLSEGQQRLLDDVKEERRRADAAEEKAKDQIKAAEEAKTAAVNEAATKLDAEIAAAKEKAEFELQTARDAAAAAIAAAEATSAAAAAKARADCDARIAECDAECDEEIAKMNEELAAAVKSVAEQKAALEASHKAHEEAIASLKANMTQSGDEAAAKLAECETTLKRTAEELETVVAMKDEALQSLEALETKQAAQAEAMSEAEAKHAELIEQATTAESRVQGVVAQLEYERTEVDRLEKDIKEMRAAEEAAAEERDAKAKTAAQERNDMLAELRALRAAAGVGDDGEELPDIDEAAVTNDSSTNANLTSRLIKANKAAEAAKRVAEDMESFRKTAQERLERIEQLESEALEADATRRKLHNQIQELRGNVRVFCRVRPTTSDTAIVDCAPDGTSVELKKTDADVAGFEFDRVFGPSSTQGEVFHEVSQLVQSALDGYKVCLFSYGQTGSGKTHTMLGDQHDEETRGIIPRAVAKVVEASQANAKKGWKYRMCASYVEIYNEQVRDLLKAGADHDEKHKIVSAPEGGCPTVSGVEREPVRSVDAAAGLVRRAAAARAVEATQMNAQSSRSHTLFLLYITGRHPASGQLLNGCLNLVDLAGSERTARSGAEGQRMKEACAINKSLSSLGDVFMSISRGDKHIPYRNSKLTHLLAPCLGGDGKTLMMVNVAPEPESAEESMCSLKFASQVNAVELGRGGAKRNIVSGIGSKKEDSSKEDSNSAGGKKTDADKKGTIKGGKRPATARTAIGAAKKAKR
jgi:kinesin family protein C1